MALSACGGAAPATSLGASSAAAKPAPSATLDIPYESLSFALTQFYVAVDQHLFANYGVNVSSELMASGTSVVQALLAGQIPMGNASQDSIISADLNGADLAILASGPEKLYFEVYAQPALKSVADLKGKKLGVTRLGSSTDFAARFLLGKNSLQPDKDVAILQVGDVTALYSALQSGAIDAAMISAPTTLKAKQAGFSRVADMTDYDLQFYSGPLVASRRWIKDHNDQALAVVKGYSAGIATVYRDKAASMRVLGKYTKTEDQAVLEDAYQRLLKILPKEPLPKPDAIKNSLGQSTTVAAKTADPNSFIDPSFVQELQNSGFYDQLYK